MPKNQCFLTDQQIHVLELRNRGFTKAKTAKQLRITREKVSLLESKARRNITRAKTTIKILEDLGVAVRILIEPETPVLDIPKIILKKADNANLRIRMDCIDLLERIKIKSRNKIKAKKVTEPISVIVLPYGDLIVE